MAYTKVFAIRSRLDRSVSYAANEKKTGLNGMIEYVVNRSKTEQRLFETAINCQSPQTAYREMCATKERWRKTGGVLGYHFIQSFAPGEVTPEQAHALGVAFARELFGDRFEVVIGTHLDKHHLHNHVVINSVSCIDGRKYHSSPESYYNGVRAVSDALCRENNLSVITPQGKGKHYAEWQAEREGKPTIRAMIRRDIDEILKESFTYKTFLDQLRRRGYAVKAGPQRKYTAIRPPDSQRFIRLDSLGAGYTESELKERLSDGRSAARPAPAPKPPRKTYRLRGNLATYRPVKLKGFRALYFKYLYLLRNARDAAPHRTKTPVSKAEVIKFERYTRQFQFLHKNRIDTDAELAMLTEALEVQIEALTEQRRELYRLRRGGDEAVSGEIAELTARLRAYRRDLRLCGAIRADIPIIRNTVMGGRESHSNNRSVAHHEENHKARPRNPLIADRGLPSRGEGEH